MNEIAFSAVVGIAGALGVGFCLVTFARKCRSAASGAWASEWTATAIALLLVAALVVTTALMTKATLALVDEPILGTFLSVAGMSVLVFLTVWLLGPIEQERDRLEMKATRPEQLSPAGDKKAA
ncbi:MAG: hypothetical protein AB7O57_06710 [Hyphomicrobiaceae bacterium]